TPREFTVFAETDAELVEVRWQGLRDLIRRDAGLRRHAEETFRERALTAFLANAPLFRHLTPKELDEVCQQAVFESYGSYERISLSRDTPASDYAARLAKEPLIAEEGAYVNGLILIRNGVVRVSQRYNNGERTISYLTAGQRYGFDEMAANWQQNAPLRMRYSLRAVGYVNVVVVPTATVEQYVRPRLPLERTPLSVLSAGPGGERQASNRASPV